MGGAATTQSATRTAGDSPSPSGAPLSFLWPWYALLAVAYCSLLPLRFDPGVCAAQLGLGISRIAFAATSLTDVVTNLLIYLPVTLLFSLRGLSRGAGRFNAALVPLAIAAGLSLSIETLQSAMPERVASWWDVLLNVTGAAAGVVIAHTLPVRCGAALDRLRRRPWHAIVMALGLALFAYHLIPFDFVTSTEALHASFRRARVELMPGYVHGSRAAAAVLSSFAAAAWFGLAAGLYANMRLRRGAEPVVAMLSGIRHGALLAALIEMLQLFTRSHAFELADIVTRSAAAVIGGTAVAILAEKSRSPSASRAPSEALRLSGLAFMLAVQVALLLGTVGSPGAAIDTSAVRTARVVPFESLWRAPAATAVTNVIDTSLTYGLLAATVALLLGYVDRRSAGPIVCLTVSAFALFVTIAEALLKHSALDVTDPAIATLAAFAVVELVHRWPRQPDQPVHSIAVLEPHDPAPPRGV